MDTSKEIEIFLHNMAWLRRHHGLSLRQMAACLEIGVWSVKKIDRGELPPKLGAGIFQIVWERFGILPSDLIGMYLDGENQENIETGNKEPARD